MDHDWQRSAGNLINRAPKRRMSFASLKTNNLATLNGWKKKGGGPKKLFTRKYRRLFSLFPRINLLPNKITIETDIFLGFGMHTQSSFLFCFSLFFFCDK
jgi:hypothetical protein